jgi:hypothetical protein
MQMLQRKQFAKMLVNLESFHQTSNAFVFTLCIIFIGKIDPRFYRIFLPFFSIR